MTPTPTRNSPSIFEHGKLKPGTYKIQNLYNETYVDLHELSKEMCCRPARDLGEGRGIWEIKPLGAGYTVQRFEPGTPDQFCTPVAGLANARVLSVAAYPLAWRIELVTDDKYRGFEYVRFYLGATKTLWDLDLPDGTGTRLQLWTLVKNSPSWWIWKLIPVKTDSVFNPSRSSSETPGLVSLPPYDRDATERSSAHAQHSDIEHDQFGTVVTEVTTTSTVVTTRKKYRVQHD